MRKLHILAMSIVPAGPEVRKLMAWLLIIRGVLYIVAYPGPTAVLPFSLHPLFDWPLYVFGALCLITGVLLAMTVHNRGTIIAGRVVTIYATAFCTFMAIGASGSYVQMSTYVILAMCGVREAATSVKDLINEPS